MGLRNLANGLKLPYWKGGGGIKTLDCNDEGTLPGRSFLPPKLLLKTAFSALCLTVNAQLANKQAAMQHTLTSINLVLRC